VFEPLFGTIPDGKHPNADVVVLGTTRHLPVYLAEMIGVVPIDSTLAPEHPTYICSRRRRRRRDIILTRSHN
jgi:hypothetical protein